jgi:hypothetical protein
MTGARGQFWGIFGQPSDAGSLDIPGFPLPTGAQEVTAVQCRMDPPGGLFEAERALRLGGFDPASHPGGVVLDLARSRPVTADEVALAGPLGRGALHKGYGISEAGGDLFADPGPDPSRVRGVHLPWPLPEAGLYTTWAFTRHEEVDPAILAWVDEWPRHAWNAGDPPP